MITEYLPEMVPGADSLVQILVNNGFTVLRNTNLNINGLNVIGIDDYWGTNFYPDIAMDLYKR